VANERLWKQGYGNRRADHNSSGTEPALAKRGVRKVLRDLGLQSAYRSDRHRLLYDFYEKCLTEAVSYDRAVGYFTSSSLAAAARGLRAFIHHDGYMRLVASPRLTDEDIEAIRAGYEAREDVLCQALLREFSLRDESPLVRARLQLLSWLIAGKRLDIKIALVDSSERGIGIYHEKFGIFVDSARDAVAFTGSANESVGGLVYNFESLEVFRSWTPEDASRVQRWREHFDELWCNSTPGLSVKAFPEAVRETMLERYTPDVPADSEPEDIYAIRSLYRRAPFGTPEMPTKVTLRDYQREAVQQWFAANGRGLWEMATGAGKTFTALAAVVQVFRTLTRHDRPLVVVVICPFQHLVDQWAEAAALFGIQAIRCSGLRTTWMPTFSAALGAVSTGQSPFLLAVATNQTFAGSAFQALVQSYTGALMIVGDEVHNLGAPAFRRALPPHAKYRLGLSATPERHFDPIGTDALYAYFGTSVFTFTLVDAIRTGALVPYRYHPILVSLAPEEEDAYLQLSERIARIAKVSRDLPSDDEPSALEHLLFQRARLIGRAAGKVPALEHVMTPLKDTTHNLVYCADSPEDGSGCSSQMDEVVGALGRHLNMKVNTYTSETSPEDRIDRRRRFASGALQALVALKCLDEGVDIPETRRGFILASTTNPRQFIQRRGRLLRHAPGKTEADLYDFLVVPPEVSPHNDIWAVERRLVARELLRVIELSEPAINGPEAMQTLLDLRRRYQLLDIGR
jgi:DNA phosphorothioation system restriction enzyme